MVRGRNLEIGICQHLKAISLFSLQCGPLLNIFLEKVLNIT
jgi:hypothetical protein